MLKCPRCGSKVRKDGHTDTDAAGDGVQRYACTKRAICKWRGIAAIGVEEARSLGINRKMVSALHRKLRKATRFVITAAQNATPVHEEFFKSLLTYCRVNSAQLVVVPYRYRNPTSRWTEEQEGDDWWAPELEPYIYNRRYDIDRHLMLLGDIMTQPTAIRPLQGYEAISGKRSAIIAHPKLELLCVPTPQSRLPKIMTTTGAVTIRNYIPAKAGKKGEFHHTFGAAVVELEGGKFHLRQINAMNDGSFMEIAGGSLTTEYRGDQVESGIPLEALNMGDTHEEFISPEVVSATFGRSGIVPTLKPKIHIWHDLHDFYRRNHHHRGDPFVGIAKQRGQMEDVEQGLRQTFAFLDKHTPAGVLSVVVKSNHPNALARWVKESDWRSDPVNASFYLRTALAMTEAAKMTAIGYQTIDPFAYWGKQWLKAGERVRFLDEDESFLVKGIECTYHGHYGSNGARGSISGFGRIGVKTIIGHGHSPGIRDGVYQNGTSTPLRLEYNKGPGSWLNTHTGIYRNGKRVLFNMIDGEWRAASIRRNSPVADTRPSVKI
jgi:hypothetical protein